MEPRPEPDTGIEGQGESPNLIVSLELLESGDVAVTLNRDAARLGDILTALELGRINVVRMYYESLDRDEEQGV